MITILFIFQYIRENLQAIFDIYMQKISLIIKLNYNISASCYWHFKVFIFHDFLFKNKIKKLPVQQNWVGQRP